MLRRQRCELDNVYVQPTGIDNTGAKPGDTLRVNVKVVEGTRSRVQAYEGVCIARRNRGLNSAFTVRKISHGEGVERIFLVHSPRIAKIEIKKAGMVRRAKLYYLRDRVGKAAKIKEKLPLVLQAEKNRNRRADTREQADAEREGARDVALLLDRVAIGDAVRGAACGEHHLDLGDRGGVAGIDLGRCLRRGDPGDAGTSLSPGTARVALCGRLQLRRAMIDKAVS